MQNCRNKSYFGTTSCPFFLCQFAYVLKNAPCQLPLWVHNKLPTLYPHVPVTNEYPVYFLCTCFRTMMDRIIIAKAKDGKRPPPFCSFFIYLCQNIHGNKTTTFFRGLFPQFPATKSKCHGTPSSMFRDTVRKNAVNHTSTRHAHNS